jgi:hypothetical protein
MERGATTDRPEVRERVLALAAVPGSDKVFGAMGHGFALDAPLTAAEVADVEAWFGVDPMSGRGTVRPALHKRRAVPVRRGLRADGPADRDRFGARPNMTRPPMRRYGSASDAQRGRLSAGLRRLVDMS